MQRQADTPLALAVPIVCGGIQWSGPTQAQAAWCEIAHRICDDYFASLSRLEVEIIIAEMCRLRWAGQVGKVHIAVSRRAQADSQLARVFGVDCHFGCYRLSGEVLDSGEEVTIGR